MIRLKWKVSSAPVGRYRSFKKRDWPSADYENGDSAVDLTCSDEYYPPNIKTGDHEEITVRVADYSVSDTEEGKKLNGTFKWKSAKMRAKTLKEAEQIALSVINAHPEIRPKEYRKEVIK